LNVNKIHLRRRFKYSAQNGGAILIDLRSNEPLLSGQAAAQ
jgi:hypothetical protein